jgi:hypothetical protein
LVTVWQVFVDVAESAFTVSARGALACPLRAGSQIPTTSATAIENQIRFMPFLPIVPDGTLRLADLD